jgi:hypothetical protein
MFRKLGYCKASTIDGNGIANMTVNQDLSSLRYREGTPPGVDSDGRNSSNVLDLNSLSRVMLLSFICSPDQ